ncbi:MAG: CRISPR-associated protein [candidate division KSB1 bacterium]|nr:CRISPR-associated protein [candidate division KSB1 bacterium]
MLLNLSNHAATKWSAEQKQAATRDFGEIRDLAFPAIDPAANLDGIIALAQEYVQRCQEQFDGIQKPASSIKSQRSGDPASAGDRVHAIHVMGEMTFVYQFVKLATAAGLRCVASTTERRTVDHPDGSKTSEFRFVRFREYEPLD